MRAFDAHSNSGINYNSVNTSPLERYQKSMRDRINKSSNTPLNNNENKELYQIKANPLLFECKDYSMIDSQKRQLDIEFNECIDSIKQSIKIKGKHDQIRISLWIQKLQEVTSNVVWKQNRNQYAKNLLQMLKTKCILSEPFSKIPPENDLPNISKLKQKSINERAQTSISPYKAFNTSKSNKKIKSYSSNKNQAPLNQSKLDIDSKFNSRSNSILAQSLFIKPENYDITKPTNINLSHFEIQIKEQLPQFYNYQESSKIQNIQLLNQQHTRNISPLLKANQEQQQNLLHSNSFNTVPLTSLKSQNQQERNQQQSKNFQLLNDSQIAYSSNQYYSTPQTVSPSSYQNNSVFNSNANRISSFSKIPLQQDGAITFNSPCSPISSQNQEEYCQQCQNSSFCNHQFSHICCTSQMLQKNCINLQKECENNIENKYCCYKFVDCSQCLAESSQNIHEQYHDLQFQNRGQLQNDQFNEYHEKKEVRITPKNIQFHQLLTEKPKEQQQQKDCKQFEVSLRQNNFQGKSSFQNDCTWNTNQKKVQQFNSDLRQSCLNQQQPPCNLNSASKNNFTYSKQIKNPYNLTLQLNNNLSKNDVNQQYRSLTNSLATSDNKTGYFPEKELNESLSNNSKDELDSVQLSEQKVPCKQDTQFTSFSQHFNNLSFVSPHNIPNNSSDIQIKSDHQYPLIYINNVQANIPSNFLSQQQNYSQRKMKNRQDSLFQQQNSQQQQYKNKRNQLINSDSSKNNSNSQPKILVENQMSEINLPKISFLQDNQLTDNGDQSNHEIEQFFDVSSISLHGDRSPQQFLTQQSFSNYDSTQSSAFNGSKNKKEKRLSAMSNLNGANNNLKSSIIKPQQPTSPIQIGSSSNLFLELHKEGNSSPLLNNNFNSGATTTNEEQEKQQKQERFLSHNDEQREITLKFLQLQLKTNSFQQKFNKYDYLLKKVEQSLKEDITEQISSFHQNLRSSDETSLINSKLHLNNSEENNPHQTIQQQLINQQPEINPLKLVQSPIINNNQEDITSPPDDRRRTFSPHSLKTIIEARNPQLKIFNNESTGIWSAPLSNNINPQDTNKSPSEIDIEYKNQAEIIRQRLSQSSAGTNNFLKYLSHINKNLC